jgi:hypothetical protein
MPVNMNVSDELYIINPRRTHHRVTELTEKERKDRK